MKMFTKIIAYSTLFLANTIQANKPFPEFSLPDLANPEHLRSLSDFPNEPFLLNVWATWCTYCMQEYPLLLDLAKNKKVKIIGLNILDDRDKALAELEKIGSPFIFNLYSKDKSPLYIALDIHRAPVTYLIDSERNIHYVRDGMLTQKDIEQKILPKLEKLQAVKNEGNFTNALFPNP